MILTQIEAKEACDWLRAAGFPQYAQLYEDSCFPIDISSVTRDHDFLDHNAIDALCRRLNTLNKCAVMRLEISTQRKRSEDSDEDEPCAISGRWTFQRDSRRWSRLEEPDVFAPPSPAGPLPGETALEELSERPELSSSHSGSSPGAGTTRTSSVTSDCSSSTSAANEDSLSEGPPELPERFVFEARPGAKGPRSKAKSFLKRMESLRLRGTSSKRKRRAGQGAGSRPEISGPILRGDLDEDKLKRLNCVDISALNALNGRSRSASHPCPARPGGSAGISSAGSSQSEASSGSAVSTPSPVARARARARSQSAQGDRGGSKRGGMYLEGFDPFSLLPLESTLVWTPGDRRETEDAPHVQEEEEDEDYGDDDEEDDGVVFFLIPEGHKLGTFPKALCNSLPHAARLRPSSASHLRRNSAGSVESRLSFYDNVPARDPEEEEGGEDLEDTLRRVGGWAEGDSDSAVDSASPCPSSPMQARPGEAQGGRDRDRDRDSTGNPLSEQEDSHLTRERRDSGVGASLSQDCRPQKMRWSVLQSSCRPGRPASALQIGCQSVVQMNLLQKFSLLTLTALLERHTPTSKHGFSWAVPKFMKRTKVRDYRYRSVFGVPLQVNVLRTGQPLPPSIQEAMCYLRNQGLDQVGLFRKSGVKSRIQALRQMNEAGGEVIYEGQSAYDVADMLKQYFRDLPEPLLTSKLSDTFLQIYQYVPKDQRLQAVRAAILLLPDENREALQTLLCFLCDVVANVAENQMTSTNLAVCLAPSLFHLNTVKRDSSSPRVMQRKQSLGKPDQRDLQENLAATQGLAHMIAECKRLFQIPEEMRRCQGSYMDQGLHPPKTEELAPRGTEGPPASQEYLREELEALLREAKDRFRGYDSCSTPERAELAYKKVHDGSALRLWKVAVEVLASPEEVLTRVLRERNQWDEDLLEARVVEALNERTEVYQYLRSSMTPHPSREHLVLRTWLTDLPKGACALVSCSVDHGRAKPLGVRANVLSSCYYMEPCGPSKSRLTHLSRVDCRGRFPEWYNKTFGHLCAAEVARIRDSFAGHVDK